MKNLLSLLLLLFIVPQVIAGPFDPPPTDQSVNVLGIIFGSNVGTIPLGGSPNPVVSDLMEKFNFIIVVVGLFVVSYVGILSVINTANEGSAMGKKWSAVWVPMRSIAGLALLVPAPASGYSMIQVTVMWIILQGIGAADALWEIALNGLASGASVSGGTQVDPSLYATGETLAKKILNAQICMETLRKQSLSQENQDTNTWLAQNGQQINEFAELQTDMPVFVTSSAATANSPAIRQAGPDTACSAPDDDPKNAVQYAEMSGKLYFGISNGSDSEKKICGAIDIIGSVCSLEFKQVSDQAPSQNEMIDAATEIYFTKILAVGNMLTSLNGLTDGFISGDFIQPVSSKDINTKIPPDGYIDAAATQYQNILSGLTILPAGGAGFANNISEEMKKQIQEGKENGWISAGSFYFIFNKTSIGKIFKSASSKSKDIIKDNDSIPSCTQPGCNTGFPSDSTSKIPSIANLASLVSLQPDLDILAYNLAMGNAYATSAKQTGSIFNAPGSGGSSINEAVSTVGSLNSSAIKSMTDMLNTNDSASDPLFGISQFGATLMRIVEDTSITVMGYVLTVSALTVLGDQLSAYGFSLPFPRLGSAAKQAATVMLAVFAIFLPVFAFMWSFGALLAVYCPLIPFMIFMMTAVGWFLTVIEAIIAAPIVALGFVLPSGDDLGKVEHALSILANIFLRPMLMLIGFILAGRVFKAVVMFVNFGMGSVFNTINVSTVFSTIVIMGVYTMFIISIANTSFSLIYALPDKILRWIGGSPEQTDTSAMGEAKGAAQSVGSEVGRGLKDIGKQAGKSLSPILSKGMSKSADTKDKG